MKVELERIKELRHQKGWSQENLGFELGITQPQYGRLENGENEFDFAKLTKIVEVFQVSPIDIIEFDEKQVYINSCNHTNIGSKSINSNIAINGFTKEDIIEIVRFEIQKVLNDR